LRLSKTYGAVPGPPWVVIPNRILNPVTRRSRDPASAFTDPWHHPVSRGAWFTPSDPFLRLRIHPPSQPGSLLPDHHQAQTYPGTTTIMWCAKSGDAAKSWPGPRHSMARPYHPANTRRVLAVPPANSRGLSRSILQGSSFAQLSSPRYSSGPAFDRCRPP
jgi:hypothetical protein